MATLIAYADGNLTGATTFKGAETGASSLAMIRANTTTLASNTNISSPTFTVTNTDVIEGVLLWLMANQASPAGTLLVELQKGGVTQASVTVNCADLPHSATGTNDVLNPAPLFFKFTATATGDGGSNWTIKLTTSNNAGAQITYNRNSGTAGDFTRALRTSTTATAAAGDDLYVVGELTGAGTHNSRTVTMDSTATTQYGNGTVNSTSANGGGVRVSCYGTLSYGTSASTNYVLRIKGDLEVFWQGTFNCGSSGSEIPRNSTAVLEFVMNAAAGDFGLIGRNLSTINMAGLSRTSGKNVAQTKLTTSDISVADVLNSFSVFNTSNCSLTAAASADGSGSLLAYSFNDGASNTTHNCYAQGPSITNTTQTAIVWLAQGPGTNNRYIRLALGNNTAYASMTNGCYVDIDLQAGTVSNGTAVGNGTYTGSSITAIGTGYLVTLTGKVSSGATNPNVLIVSCSAAGTTSYAGGNNVAFYFGNLNLITASSLADTTYNVVDDTGWLSGDSVCVASTSRTATDCYATALNANAGGSSFTAKLYPVGAMYNVTGSTLTFSGTAPTKAEIGLLTRNVKVRSTSATLWTYVYGEPLSTITISWTEFYYIGVNSTSTKRGMELAYGTVTSAKSITYCSFHDSYYAIFGNTSVGNNTFNLTISNNVVFNTTNIALTITGGSTAPSSSDWTISANLVMRPQSSGISLTDIGGTLTNNTVVGAPSGAYGIILNTTYSSRIPVTGSFSGNVCHSCAGHGIGVLNSVSGTIDTQTIWRNGTTGILYNVSAGSTVIDLIFSNVTIFGCPTGISGAADALNLTGSANIICGDTTFSCSTAIVLPAGNQALTNWDIRNLDTSGASLSGGIGAAPTSADIQLSGNSYTQAVYAIFVNCKMGAATLLSFPSLARTTLLSEGSYFSFEKYGQTAGDHRTEMKYGQLKTDTTIYSSASPSMRMTHNSSTKKLESAPRGKGILVPAINGQSSSLSANVRKSVIGDGAAYNGNQPRLIQRANPALGQNADVVLATYSASAGSWNLLNGTTSVATDDGAWELIVDADGTAGFVNVEIAA